MMMPSDIREYECLGHISAKTVIEMIGLANKNVLGMTHIDYGAGESFVAKFFQDRGAIVQRIDPMYLLEEEELGKNGRLGTLRLVKNTINQLEQALNNNEKIDFSKIDYFGLTDNISSICAYKGALKKLITMYQERAKHLLTAKDELENVPKYPDTSHILDGTIDIITINALLHDTDYPVDILMEANRILSTNGKMYFVDYKNYGQNKLYKRAKETGIGIYSETKDFFCIELRKGDYQKLRLWRDFGEYAARPLKPEFESRNKVRTINFNGYEVPDDIRLIDDAYLNQLLAITPQNLIPQYAH